MSKKVSYDHFATVADQYWQSFGPEFSALIRPRIDALLRRFHIRPKTLLDLGCGTGSFALQMASRGLRVTGLDASATALRIARQKAAFQKLKVHWRHGDMRDFFIRRPFDLVSSIFNSLNHLLSIQDLAATFACVSGSLRPGGYFLFDINNEACFKQVWGGTSVVRRKKFILIRSDELRGSERRASAHLLIFLKRGSLYRSIEDCIEERWFTPREIETVAKKSGFEVLFRENFNPFAKRFGYSNDIKSLWLLRRNT